MAGFYKHTGKDKDYGVYKKELNAATNEVRKSKRNFEYKIAQLYNQTEIVSMRMYEVSRMFEIR